MTNSQSRSGSSEDDYEDEAVTPEAQWHSQKQGSSNAMTSVGGSLPSSTQPSQVLMPMQKRRRVTRACDECRRKKIKCDGKQPCTHCTVYSYGRFQKALLPNCTSSSLLHEADQSFTQNVPMTNHRIEDVTHPLTTLKIWKAGSSAPKLSYETSFRT